MDRGAAFGAHLVADTVLPRCENARRLRSHIYRGGPGPRGCTRRLTKLIERCAHEAHRGLRYDEPAADHVRRRDRCEGGRLHVLLDELGRSTTACCHLRG